MKITNTLSGSKEIFRPLQEPKVSMYVCGITPYDFAHLGHGRSAVAFDLLFRTLKFVGYDVEYCRNFTDIDDKIIARAVKELGSADRYHEIAQKYMTAYQEDMLKLSCITPEHQPLVTQTIKEIITFVQGLIDVGMAYEVDGDVYFRVSKFHAYGELSKQKISELRSGARVDVNEKKEDPLDFALWKKEDDGNFWKSPWGYGRPGWHIECSVMAAKYLGEQIDIHGGGMDLMFPHHENEIAQSQGLSGKQFVRYWVHNAFVRINKEKMSKSLGNFFTLREVFEKYPPVLIRYYFLNHHYRSPLDFSFEDIDALHKNYQRLCRVFATADAKGITPDEIKKSNIVQKMLAFLTDDLNTPGMWGVVFENLDTLQNNPQELRAVKAFINEALGLPLELLPEKKVEMTPEIERLLQEREAARAAKDWKKSDVIRDQLTALGYQVQDKKI